MAAVLVAMAVMHVFLSDSGEQSGHGYAVPVLSQATAQLFKYHPAFGFAWESPLPSYSVLLLSCHKDLLPKGLSAGLQPATPMGDRGVWQPLPTAGHGAGELYLGSHGPWLALNPWGCEIPSH